MAGTTPLALTGRRPLTFTDTTGAQRFVPLSAFELTGSSVQLKTAWQSAFSAGDTTILLALADAAVEAGEVKPPPVAAPAPAIGFRARTPGVHGNAVVVTLAPDPGPALTAPIAISVRETAAWAGLASAQAAVQALGVDAPPETEDDPAEGTGLVRVRASGPLGEGLPEPGQTLTVEGPTEVLGVPEAEGDDPPVLFALVPRAGTGAAPIEVTITVDEAAGTFSIAAVYEATDQPKVTLDALDELPDPVAFILEASPPPAGYARPAAQDVRLSGGGPGVAATGVAYTS